LVGSRPYMEMIIITSQEEYDALMESVDTLITEHEGNYPFGGDFHT
jgi:hypothetical protein